MANCTVAWDRYAYLLGRYDRLLSDRRRETLDGRLAVEEELAPIRDEMLRMIPGDANRAWTPEMQRAFGMQLDLYEKRIT